MLKLSKYVVSSDSMRVTGDTVEQRMLFSTRFGTMIEVGETVWQFVIAGRCNELPIQIKSALLEAKFLVSDTEDELQSVVHENMNEIQDDEVLYQVIQPTAWCQLGCGYCGQTHAKRKLADDDQRGLVERVDQKLGSGRYRELSIGWFGGEPLLGLSVMRDLTPVLIETAGRHGCGFSAKIVTNGLALTPALARELVTRHKIAAAEVTLDGVDDLHDQKRPTKAGISSFHRIFENLRAVISSDIGLAITVRCNVDRKNYQHVPALIEKLSEEGWAGKIEFYASPVYAWGNDAGKSALPADEYASHEVEWLALLIRLGFRPGLIPGRRKIVCLSVQRDAEVLDAYGTRFNCTEVPYVEAYGKPNVYALDEKSRLTGAATKLRNFNEDILRGEHLSCSSCPMLPVCGGQCPKSWMEGNVPCPPPKYNIRERLNIAYALSRTEREGTLQ